MTDLRTSRISTETLATEEGTVRTSRSSVETLAQGNEAVRVSRVSVEVLLSASPNQNEGTGRIYEIDVETIHKETLPVPPTYSEGGWGFIPIGILVGGPIAQTLSPAELTATGSTLSPVTAISVTLVPASIVASAQTVNPIADSGDIYTDTYGDSY